MLLEPIQPSACDGGGAGMRRSGSKGGSARRRRGEELPLEESWLNKSEESSVLVEDPVDCGSSGSSASAEREREKQARERPKAH